MCLSPLVWDVLRTYVGNGPIARLAFMHFSIQGQICTFVAIQFIRQSESRFRLIKLVWVNVLAIINISAIVWWGFGATKVQMEDTISMVHISVLLCSLYVHACKDAHTGTLGHTGMHVHH